MTWLSLVVAATAFYFLGLMLLQLLGRRSQSNSQLPNLSLDGLSVIIPMRNEAHNLPRLAQSIRSQAYHMPVELIIVDDFSSDTSRALAAELFPKANIIDLNQQLAAERQLFANKKQGLQLAVQAALYSAILCLDADGAPRPQVFQQHFDALHHHHFITGPVHYTKARWWQHFIPVEQWILTAIAEKSMHLGRPVLANGANLSFHKQVYLDCAQAQKADQLASGDDMALLQAVSQHPHYQANVLTDVEASVATTMPASFLEFCHQRIRWASKMRFMQAPSSYWVLVAFFGFNLAWIAAFIQVLIAADYSTLLIMLSLKIIPEFVLACPIAKRFGQLHWMRYFVLCSLLYPIYVVVFGLLSFWPNYHWKGRLLHANRNS